MAKPKTPSPSAPAPELRFDPRNARAHPERNKAMIRRSLEEIGGFRSIAVDGEGIVRAGNGVLEQAQALGMTVRVVDATAGELIAVRRLDLTGRAAERAALLDNRTAETSEWDTAVLAEMVASDKELLDGMFSDADLKKLGVDLGAKPDDVEPQISRAAELQVEWGTKLGQLWELGPHRLLIGDSRDRASVDRLMDGKQADLVLTDPPYGVDYVGKTANALPVHNDDAAGLPQLLESALGNALAVSREGACWYVCAPGGPQMQVFADWMTANKVWRQTIIWVKDSMVMGHSDYHYQHELLFYGWKDGAAHRAPPTRNQTTIWAVERPKASREHPTMKPVELFDRAVENSTERGWTVFDPFAGSGTSLMSADRLGRVARVIEIAPEYAAVILQRWADSTGQRPSEVKIGKDRTETSTNGSEARTRKPRQAQAE